MSVSIERNFNRTVHIDSLNDGDAFEQNNLIYIVNRLPYSEIIGFSICGKDVFTHSNATDNGHVQSVNLRVIVE